MPQPVSLKVRQTNRPGAASGFCRAAGGVDGHGCSLDVQLAPARHGVARIDRQVEQDLLDHAQIGLDGGQAGGKIHLQGDVLAQDAAEHLGNIVDNFIQIHHLGMEFLFAAEGHQLAGQRAGPLAGLDDFLERFGALGAEMFPRP